MNLLAFYHHRRPLIGYATHYLLCCTEIVGSVAVCSCQQNGGRFFTFSKCP